MTAVPVPALVAAITDELAKHVEMPSGFCLCQAWDAPLLNHHGAHVAERVAAAVVGLLPGLPPEDLAALIGGTVEVADWTWLVREPVLRRAVGPWVPVSLPAPAEPERSA